MVFWSMDAVKVSVQPLAGVDADHLHGFFICTLVVDADQAIGRHTEPASHAAGTLRELLDASNEPGIRLNASKAMLRALSMMRPIHPTRLNESRPEVNCGAVQRSTSSRPRRRSRSSGDHVACISMHFAAISAGDGKEYLTTSFSVFSMR
jgi:hypothetical protein